METAIPSEQAKEIARQLAQLRGPALEAVMLEDLAATLKHDRESSAAHQAKMLDLEAQPEDENVIHLGDSYNVSHLPAAPQQQAAGTSTAAKVVQGASLVVGGAGLGSLALMAAGLLGGLAPQPEPQQSQAQVQQAPQPTSIIVTPATVQAAPQSTQQPMPQAALPQPTQQHPIGLVPGGMRIQVLPPR